MMRCIIRPLLLLQSVFYLLIGLVLLTWATIYGLEKFENWDGSELSCIAVSNIAAGGLVFILGLMGLFTSCSGSYSWAYCYSIIILVFIIVQCISGILVVFFRYEVEKVLVTALKQSMGNYSFHGEGTYHSMLRSAWDSFQTSLQCCGTQSRADWEEMGQSVPWSCKKVDTGCLKMLASVMSENVVIVIVVVVSFMVIQIFGVCLSCCLARSVQVEHMDF